MANIPLTFLDHWYPADNPDGIAFRRFLDAGPTGFDVDAMSLAHILQHYNSALVLADRPNVTLFHYADMKRDLSGTFAQLAELLGITHPEPVMEKVATGRNL